MVNRATTNLESELGIFTFTKIILCRNNNLWRFTKIYQVVFSVLKVQDIHRVMYARNVKQAQLSVMNSLTQFMYCSAVLLIEYTL